MDGRYLYGLLSFVIGLAAGIQGVYERYARDSLSALATLPGFFYLLTRGLLPAAIFLFLYGYGLIDSKLFLYALACGTGTEVVLRSKVYVKQTQTGAGNVEELLRGPLDLLRWYQNLFLELSAGRLAKRRKAFVAKNLPTGVAFAALCVRVVNNLPAWPNEEMRNRIGAVVKRLERESQNAHHSGAAPLPADLEQKYRLQLGYFILNVAGKSGFGTLLAN